MKLEKFVLSIIGIFFGLLVAGSAFYFYQKITSHPTNKKIVPVHTTKTPTPSPTPSFFVNIDTPKDESVTDNKTVTVSGKTIPTATVIVSTGAADQVITPSSQGDFSTTVTIDTDENQLIITAIAPSGEEVRKTITVTYSTQEF
ncbi:MAG TPA: hypothetical protein VLF89_03280 [Candidatus Saccharimonadales bacterium]|nr:hypothetical protein [Candidatus Saccharimonadales bacterium]